MPPTEISAWLEGKYIAWISETGQRRTITEFADWLDISRPILSGYMNGSRRPGRENADKLAARLGPEIYDLLGLQRPDPLLQRLQAHWDALDPSERAEIEALVGKLEDRKDSASP